MTANDTPLNALFLQRNSNVEWFDAFPGESFAPRILGAQTSGAFSLIEARIAPMAGPPLHIHHDAHEWFYMLDGRLEFLVRKPASWRK
jgi:quercetin dioxygenase-like cupin family protein